METKFNFNSQVCTSREQSEKLLALGLKKETADMCYKVTTHDFKGNEINEKDRHYTLCCWYDESSLVCGLERKETIPAWSLHRLLSLIEYDDGFIDVSLRGARYGIHYGYDDGWYDNLYDAVISCIEALIEEKDFNKEYLV